LRPYVLDPSITNPLIPSQLQQITTASLSDIDDAVSAARECFEMKWGTNTSGQARGKLIFKLADALEREGERIAKVESVDSGKPLACELELCDEDDRGSAEGGGRPGGLSIPTECSLAY
jgi:acyl-CoA reductase-like NAD-dependent aldehyde dehydrogenase